MRYLISSNSAGPSDEADTPLHALSAAIDRRAKGPRRVRIMDRSTQVERGMRDFAKAHDLSLLLEDAERSPTISREPPRKQ